MAEIEASTTIDKSCKACGQTKPLTKFPKCSRARDGRMGTCNSCREGRRSPDSRAVASERVKRWKATNAKRWQALKAAQSERSRDRMRVARAPQRAEALRLRRDRAEQIAATRQARADARKEARATRPWLAPGLSAADRYTIRYRTDPAFNLRQRVRAHWRRTRQGYDVGKLARAALRCEGRSPTLERLVGYDVETLKVHLARQFTRGMDWPTFMSGEIHIDHIVPLAAFDLTDPDQFRAAWALTNLRPLEASANQAKASHRTHLL